MRYDREELRRRRVAALEVLGGKCSHCPVTDWRCLQIDHVGGGGNKDRKKTSTMDFYRRVLLSVLRGEKKYQLLCANCNWIKRHEEQEAPRVFTR